MLPEFNDVVSPWNTRESMRTSDDVAQLLVSDRIVVISVYGRTVKYGWIFFFPCLGKTLLFTVAPLPRTELFKTRLG